MNESALHVKVLFFATLREAAGVRQIELDLAPDASVRDLKEQLVGQFPALRRVMTNVVVAVNHEFAQDADLLPDSAEVALFPPVSGGSADLPTICLITEEELDLNALLRQITLPNTGAACFFTGVVRAVTERESPHQTTFLDYEAYLPMAEKKMIQVVEEIRARWSAIQGIAIVQRVGRLSPGTPTVLIACTAAHRDTGVFEAARYGIDRLKEIVPVWKREVGPDGQEWVEGTYLPTRED